LVSSSSSPQLLSDIYGLGMEKSSGVNSQLACKIGEMATSIDQMVDDHIKVNAQPSYLRNTYCYLYSIAT